MDANVGVMDRSVRLVLGTALLLSPLWSLPVIWSSQALAYLAMALGLILIGTGLFGFCPLYRVLGIATRH